MSTPPKEFERFDIREKLLQFDSQRLRHKNAPWKGDRYVLVFFNKDLNYADSDHHKRSVRIRNQPPQPHRWLPTLPQTPDVESAKQRLLQVLSQTSFLQDRCSGLRIHPKYGNKRGTFISFGLTQSRKNRTKRRAQGLHTRKNANQNNAKYRQLFDALCVYVNAVSEDVFGVSDKCRFTSCIVAKNSQCEWHTDSGNIGPAALMTLGSFRGGELLVEKSA